MGFNLRIIAAAIKDVDGRVFFVWPPGRHHTVLRVMREEFGREQKQHAVQGFLISEYEFVDRVEAKRIAVVANQQIPRHMDLKELFSEDVW